MTIETITDHDQPDFEPGDSTPRAQPAGGLTSRSTQAEKILADAESLIIAFLQSALLTAISASLHPWALSLPASESVDPVKCVAALDEAMHALFPMRLQLPGAKFLLGVLE
jgi:hypothetical protein